jgi:hypothetical protein
MRCQPLVAPKRSDPVNAAGCPYTARPRLPDARTATAMCSSVGVLAALTAPRDNARMTGRRARPVGERLVGLANVHAVNRGVEACEPAFGLVADGASNPSHQPLYRDRRSDLTPDSPSVQKYLLLSTPGAVFAARGRRPLIAATGLRVDEVPRGSALG